MNSRWSSSLPSIAMPKKSRLKPIGASNRFTVVSCYQQPIKATVSSIVVLKRPHKSLVYNQKKQLRLLFYGVAGWQQDLLNKLKDHQTAGQRSHTAHKSIYRFMPFGITFCSRQ